MALRTEQTASGWRCYDPENAAVDEERSDRIAALNAAQEAAAQWEKERKEKEEAQAEAVAHIPSATGYVPLNQFGAACFTGVLAYPQSREKQERFTDAFEAWLRAGARKRGKLTLGEARNFHTERKRDYERAILAAFRRIKRERLPIVTELFRRQLRISFDSPEGMAAFFEGVAKHWALQGYSAHEAQARHVASVWAATKPALHLAAAFNELVLPLCVTPDGLNVAEVFYQWEAWLAPALERGEALRKAWTDGRSQSTRIEGTTANMADAIPQLKLREADTIKLLLDE